MTPSPTISVVMAVHNEEAYISEAIESILRQTFKDFEFIIIDDCSTDSTADIIEQYGSIDDRIRILSNYSNLGLPASLNKGIEHAQGKYIARMDGDDISRSERFEKQVRYLDEHPDKHVVGCYVFNIAENGDRLRIKQYDTSRRTVAGMKEHGPRVAHPSILMRKTSVTAVGKYRPVFTYLQDVDLYARFAKEYGPDFLHIIPEVLLEHRLTSGQRSRMEVNHIYRQRAGDLVGREEELRRQIEADIKSQEADLTDIDSDFWYNYRVGRILLNQYRNMFALKYFMRAIINDPIRIRGWYGLALVCTPRPVRRRLVKGLNRFLQSGHET